MKRVVIKLGTGLLSAGNGEIRCEPFLKSVQRIN